MSFANRLHSRALALAVAAFMFAPVSIAPAQDAQTEAPTAEDLLDEDLLNIDPDSPEAVQTREAESQLSEIIAARTLSQERIEALQREIEELGGDRTQQNAELIAAGQRIKLAEIEVSDAEARLSALLVEEAQIRERLDGEDIRIAALLAALQRISKNPPPAIVINPTDANNAARSAALLSAVLPEIRARAAAVSADLNAFITVRQGVEEEKQILSARLSSLEEERLRIGALIEARRLGFDRATSELAAEQALAAELAEQASSLNQLVEALRERIEAVDAAVNAIGTASSAPTELDPESVLQALADTSRTEPAYPISSGAGFLTRPTSGVTITDFGNDDGFGGISKGLFVVTRAEAQVVAPVDGWVLYRGPYLNYGQIIIFSPGEGHMVLLAGLNELNVELGQFILQGEPVGTMGARTQSATLATNAGVSRPTLYIEFRKNNVPFDPAPLWEAETGAQSSG